MTITVLTPDKEVYTGNIKSVKVPGSMGQFQVLKNHAPIVSSLDAGKIAIITEDGTAHEYTVEGGFIEVLNNEISLLVRGLQE